MARTLEKKTLTDWRKTRGLSVEEFAERIERLKLAKAFLKLDPADQDDVLNVIANRLPR